MLMLLLTAGLALANGATTVSVQHSAASGTVEMRHCAYQMYATTKNHHGPAGDYVWNLVPALNGNTSKSAISFQSSDFPSKYASIITGDTGRTSTHRPLEPGRMGVVLPPADKNDASFEQITVAGGAKVSFKSLSTGKFAGMLLTLTSGLEGSCSSSYKKTDGEGDVVLAAGTAGDAAATWTLAPATAPPAPPTPPPPGPVSVSVAVDEVTHQISPLVMGCHSDSGYAHQARGFYSQMIVGDSFNATGFAQATWNIRADPGVDFSATMDEADQFYGAPSEKLVYVSGKGLGSLSNRGLGNAGMFLEAGKAYEGFIFAKVAEGAAAASATLTVALDNYVAGTTLDSATLTISPAGAAGSDENGFARYNFTLTPSAGTSCVDIAPGSDPEVNCGDGKPRSPVGHTCVKCGGEFKLSLDAPSSVVINYVFLQPGAWGRINGLPVLASAASVLKQMGVKAIRQGGSYASVATGNAGADYYQWQKWAGPAWTRPSRTDGVWKKCLLSGWGPFEMIDMCNALDIEPVITTTETSTAESFAELVEYAWGNTSTKMGAQRTADGHPAQYKVKYFELGNEQYNPNYVEQVAAMEAKAVELGIGGTFHYMFPQNNFLNQADLTKAAALSPRLDSQMVADVHIGGGGAVEAARKLFASNTSFKMGAVNAETNAGTHVFSRAMSEAADLNDWFNAADVADRLHFRAASFCMGDSTDFDSWDQGISFFLPNMTWLQPPGYVHQMVDRSWQPNALNVTGAGSDSAFSAQKSDDGKTVVLRYVNYGADEVKVTVTLTSGSAGGSSSPTLVQMWTIASDDPDAANSPANPTAVSPVGPVNVPGFASGSTLMVKPSSYTVVVMTF